LYVSSNVILTIKSGRMRWVEHVVRMREMRSAYNIFIGKHEGKRPLGRHRHRWKYIRMDVRERW